MISWIKKRLKTLVLKNKKDEILCDQYYEMLMLSLSAINRSMQEEMTNLSVQLSIIHRKMKSLSALSNHDKDLLRKNDKRAMRYEEGIYQRMEIKKLIDVIQARLDGRQDYIKSFLTDQCYLPVDESWIHCITRFTPERNYKPGQDYSSLLYILSLLAADLEEKELAESGSQHKLTSKPFISAKEKLFYTRP